MPTLQLFATCLIETIRPEAGMAVVEVLERLGYTFEYPEGQTCCGQPAFNGGLWDDARAMAKHTLDVLNRSDAPIIVPSGSCADMIIHHYPELFKDDAVYRSLAESVAKRTYEFSQFLVDVVGVEKVSARFDGKIVYHPSCHLLRGLNVKDQPQRILDRIEGLEVCEQQGKEECCGFGGLFSVKMSDISGAMMDRKIEGIKATGAKTVVGCDVSCLMHIGGGLHRKGLDIETKHLAELMIANGG
jgi:L-lactate dehydrogenase complex protein LldE